MTADDKYSIIARVDVLSFELDSSKDKTDAFKVGNRISPAYRQRPLSENRHKVLLWELCLGSQG